MLLEALEARTKVPIDTLEKIAASASNRYKVYNIPKKTGGVRTICQPSKSVKALQRWLTRNLLSTADVHAAATAYEKGSSIRTNAMRHAGSSFTLRMDFSEFFPSFDDRSVSTFLKKLCVDKNIAASERDIFFATRIFCRSGRLTIGAPSSPKLTNAMMFEFDSELANYSIENNLIYTRYADDLFISSFQRDLLGHAQQFILDLVGNLNQPVLKINSAKTLHLSKARHRSVTGLVLTSDGHVSLGRERKREIKTLVYKAMSGSIATSDRGYLSGMIAFAQDADPDFVASLSRKFGTDVAEWAKLI